MIYAPENESHQGVINARLAWFSLSTICGHKKDFTLVFLSLIVQACLLQRWSEQWSSCIQLVLEKLKAMVHLMILVVHILVSERQHVSLSIQKFLPDFMLDPSSVPCIPHESNRLIKNILEPLSHGHDQHHSCHGSKV